MKNKRFHYEILAIVSLGFLLRLYVGYQPYLNTHDERYHALVAKNLMRHPLVPTLYDNPVFEYDYRNWAANHIWLHKPPMALWLMAMSMKLFGVNEVALRLPSIILSSLAIFLTYYIGACIFGYKVGLLAAFFHATNWFLIKLAGGEIPTDHVDTIFIFFVELGVFLAVVYAKHKKNYIIPLIGLVAGLAVLTKWLTGLIIFVVWLILMIGKEKWQGIFLKFLAVIMICLTVFVPWQIYIHRYFPKEAIWEAEYNFLHIFEALEGPKASIFFYIIDMQAIFFSAIYLSVFGFLVFLLKQKQKTEMTALIVWAFLPYIAFSLCATKMSGYVMISAAALFIIQAFFCMILIDSSYEAKIKYSTTVFLPLLLLLLVLPTVKNLNLIPKKTIYDNKNKSKEVFTLLEKELKGGKYILFTRLPIEAMFYSSHTAYGFIPTAAQVKELNDSGYKIAIFDNGELPYYIKNNKDAVILKLRDVNGALVIRRI